MNNAHGSQLFIMTWIYTRMKLDIQVTTSALSLIRLTNIFSCADTLAYRYLPVTRIIDFKLVSRRSSEIPASHRPSRESIHY